MSLIRGVRNTERERKVTTEYKSCKKYIVDWLSFTSQNFEKILQELKYNLDDFEEQNGRYFYNKGLKYKNNSNINIYYNDDKSLLKNENANSVCFIFTGKGCSDLFSKFDTVFEVFEILIKHEVKITRIDIALDDFVGMLDLDVIVNKLQNKEYRSVKKSFNFNRGLGVHGGLTIYIGNHRLDSSKGNDYIRMYDKKAQMLSKSDNSLDCDIWNRYEISLSKEKAQSFVYTLMYDENFKYDIDKLYKSVFRRIIEFVVPDENKKNKSRWELCDWYMQFIDDVDKIKFDFDSDNSQALNNALNWIISSVLPTLKLIDKDFEKRGYDLFDLLRNVELLTNAMSDKQLAIQSELLSLDDSQFSELLRKYFK